jgi:hypothetical protein
MDRVAPLSTLLKRLAAVAADAGVSAEAMQSVLSSRSVRAEDMIQMQGLDHLTQQIADIERALLRLAEQTRDDPVVDLQSIVQDLHLAAVSARLAGSDAASPAASSLELF